ncbi:MAG: hypothetical protein HY905_07300 [Deltaproteobacteria bacterium]|nr:hypothetical protein [Deltaproteobacteria bacterium]
MQIRERVEVRVQPTVVRLEESAAAPWITEAYYLTDEVRAHLDAVRRTLAGNSGSGVFLIGPYGSGKSHLLAYLTQRIRAGELARPAPDVTPLSLLNYSAEARLEDVVAGGLGLEVGPGDRREAWATAMAAHPAGLVLVIDELSEFLRAKPDAPASPRTSASCSTWASGHRTTACSSSPRCRRRSSTPATWNTTTTASSRTASPSACDSPPPICTT